MRPLARWTSLSPSLQHIRAHPPTPRIQRALHILTSDEKEAVPLLPESSSSSATKGTGDESAKEPISALASNVEAEATNRMRKGKGRGKRFKSMEGKSMKPVSALNVEPIHSNNVLLTSGTILDKTFQPLKDVRLWRRKHVPKLAHGLGTVLTRKGVHWLKDPETNRYNFDKYLEDIPKVKDFAFDRLGGFVPSSRDKTMIALAKQAKCKYAGSTSSLTGILAQIYLLLSQERLLNTSNLSPAFDDAPKFFTPGQRIPASVILRYQDGVYTTDVDTDREENTEEIILLSLGILLEKFLTMPPDNFKKFFRSYNKDYPQLKDVHRYAKHGEFLMRSQLDCVDDSLPGTGVFDLKTRAISPIRHDVYNYLNYLDCTLDSLTGRRGSFEEEYYDMMRSAFLEYSFQARIGNMDGIMVAYHNTARIFGFQYVSLREMDLCLFGREGAGTRVFLRCVYLMELLYAEITKCFPAQSVRCTFEKRGGVLRVWVEPLEFHDPQTEPPIIELTLSIKNIMHGKAMPGPYAVYADKYPWSVQYEIKRSEGNEEAIRKRRDFAYKRQLLRNQPDTDVQLQEQGGVSTEPSEDSTNEPEQIAELVEGELVKERLSA